MAEGEINIDNLIQRLLEGNLRLYCVEKRKKSWKYVYLMAKPCRSLFDLAIFFDIFERRKSRQIGGRSGLFSFNVNKASRIFSVKWSESRK